jgi:hypothetical protein
VRRLHIIFLFCLLSLAFCRGQEPATPPEESVDTVAIKETTEKLKILDSLLVQKEVINPLAPSKAAFYSAVLPGLGQIYNKRYWKAPLVWGAMGGTIYGYAWNNNNYKRFRTAFKRRQAGFIDDEFYDLQDNNPPGSAPDLDLGDLENQQERFQEARDLMLVFIIAAYALNIVEANVDAHLKQFNIDDDLSFDFQPYLDLDAISNSAHYGMALTIKF